MKWLVAVVVLLSGCQTSVSVPSQEAADVGSEVASLAGLDTSPDSEPSGADLGGLSTEETSSMSGDTTSAPEATRTTDTLSADGVNDGARGGVGAETDACAPDCSAKACGDDGCGGSCGLCPTLWSCQEGTCVEDECLPLCGGLECGLDGCGGLCGLCAQGEECEEGQCVVTCTCEGKECGDDGCGLSCGACDPAYTCVGNLCEIVEGSWSCTEILGCQDQCAPDASLCLDACVQGGDLNGQYEYQLYATCLSNHECDDKLCIAEHCSSETAICEYEENGALSCAEIVTCQNQCDATDQDCIDACIPLGTIAGQAQYISLVYCLQFFCPLGSLPDCVNISLSDATLCADFYQACLEP